MSVWHMFMEVFQGKGVAWDRRWGLTLTDSSAVEESHKQVGCHKGSEEWKEHRPDLGLARVPETSRL